MNLHDVFGFAKRADALDIAPPHRYADQTGAPAELRVVDPTAWDKLKRGVGTAAISVPLGHVAGHYLGHRINDVSGRGGAEYPSAYLGALAGLGYGIHSGMNTPQRLVARAAPPPSNIPNQEPSHVEASKLSSLRGVFGFDKAAAPVMAPGLLKRLSAALKGGKVAK